MFAGVRFSGVFRDANTYEHKRTSAEIAQVGEHLGEHILEIEDSTIKQNLRYSGHEFIEKVMGGIPQSRNCGGHC